MKKVMRVSAFLLPYFVTSVPLIERVLRCYFTECADVSIILHFRQFVWAFTGILFYSLHIPECFAPGYFDIIGNSHQILHIMGVLASYDQLWACYLDLTTRRELFAVNDVLPSGFHDTKLIFGVLFMNVVIVAAFSWILKKRVFRPTFSLSEMNLKEFSIRKEKI